MKKIFAVLLSAVCMTSGIAGSTMYRTNHVTAVTETSYSMETVPEFSGDPYVTIDFNQPDFESGELTTSAFENYSELDELGRCGTTYANICTEIMPTEERGEIGMIKPSGWQSVKYDCVDGKYLYNRCHLIGYQLAGENANEKNLITGTRYLNIDGMLPFENKVADYVESTGNHVLYRVTPEFEGNNLVADGVQMEAYSVEDNGEGICYNVYCYNAQPGVNINYATGESTLAVSAVVGGDANGDGNLNIVDAITIARAIMQNKLSSLPETADYNGDGKINIVDVVGISRKIMASTTPTTPKVTTAPRVTTKPAATTTVKKTTTTVKTTTKPTTTTKKPSGVIFVDVSNAKYILNTSTKKFHYPSCTYAGRIAAKNKAGANDRAALIKAGYSACAKCNP